jgi:hypothetical protein
MFCQKCGKKLSFFTGLFKSICDDCSKSNNTSSNVVETRNQETISNVGGEIEYFGLKDWWLNELTPEERQTIITVYNPFGFDKRSLYQGKIEFSTQTTTGFLTGLLSWFRKPEYQTISVKIIKRLNSIPKKSMSIEDEHFFYQMQIETYYRNRESDKTALASAVEACKQQISISSAAKRTFLSKYPSSPLPSHVGYTQLCIILEKQQLYDEVIDLAQKAKKQGWNGEWDKRIERCMKKKIKSKSEKKD